MANFAIKNLNGWNNVEGKIFLGEELGLTGAEASVQRLAAGEILHSFIHTKLTKNSTSSFRAKANMRLTE